LDKVYNQVSHDGRNASVTEEVFYAISMKDRFIKESGVRVITMEKRRDGWIILSVR
jgi:hypothetical protein